MGLLRAASEDVRALRLPLVTVVLVLGAALGLAACGGGDANLLPGKTAEEINRNLDQVRAFAAEGDCAGAESAVAEVNEQVSNLEGVDKKLQAALRQGANRLGAVVSSCGERALAEAEAEREAEEAAEQEEQAAVEAEEEELAAEEQREQKADEKAEKEVEKEEKSAEKEAEQEEPETPGGEGPTGNDNGPPAETPSGVEPPAGGVGPGTEVE